MTYGPPETRMGGWGGWGVGGGREHVRREGGCSRCTAGRDAAEVGWRQQTTHKHLERQKYTMHRTETSRNLTKRFRKNNNSDLKHQRVI